MQTRLLPEACKQSADSLGELPCCCQKLTHTFHELSVPVLTLGVRGGVCHPNQVSLGISSAMVCAAM